MKTSLLAALFLVFLYAAPVMAQTFGAERFTLENGMEVVVIPNHRAPVVTHMVWMKAGAADERPGLSGMAHYLEHLLFKGTEKQAPGEFSRIVKTLGGNDNAFTGQDYTAYYQSIAVEHLERVMEMEADRMMNANPPPAHFASEKAVVIEERRQRTDNDPRARFAEQLSSVLFINHPYGMPIIGWMNEIEKYEWPDVKQFYETWYAPNNAILIVSGDITAKELKPLAEKYYGALKRRDIPARIRPELPPAPAQVRLILRDAAIHQPVYQSLYAAPSQRMNKDDALALEVLAEIMDGGPTTRLYTNLVVNQKKAVSVFFNYSAAAYDYARLSMGAIPADGGTTDEMEALLDREIAVLLESGVTETEVRDAIQRLQDQAVFARDGVSGPAMIFGAALATGLNLDDVENWPQDIAKVTKERVHEAARKYLNPASPWIRPPARGHLLPLDKTKAAQPVQNKRINEDAPNVEE